MKLLLSVCQGQARALVRRVEGPFALHLGATEGGEDGGVMWVQPGPGRDSVAVFGADAVLLGRLRAGGVLRVGEVELSLALEPTPGRTDRLVPVNTVGPLTLRLDDGREHTAAQGRMCIGQDPGCDLVLDDGAVSAVHCQVALEPEGWVLSDLGSTNGTWVGGARIERALLTQGAEVTVGRSSLRVVRGTRQGAGAVEADSLVGSSEAMRRLRAALVHFAANPYAVLVRGETGSGKELVARAVHRHSPMGRGPFVAINCAVLKAELAESELFGHERGAFTGADRRRRGVFEEAHTGTLFLDEVAELSPPAQASLLRVLETGALRRVGGEQEIRVKVRVVSATCRDLPALVAQGRFREDLYYRLAQFEIHVPPLRARASDLPALTAALLHRIAEETGRERDLDDDAMRRLMAHPWPGNVRELLSVLRRAACLAEGRTICAHHLDASGLPPSLVPYASTGPRRPRAPSVLHDAHRTPSPSPLPPPPPPPPTEAWPAEVPPGDLVALLHWCDGNLSRLAHITGVARTTLRRRLAAADPSPHH